MASYDLSIPRIIASYGQLNFMNGLRVYALTITPLHGCLYRFTGLFRVGNRAIDTIVTQRNVKTPRTPIKARPVRPANASQY